MRGDSRKCTVKFRHDNKLGFSTNETMASLPDTLALAAAGGLDLARAADIASNVMSGFDMMSGDVAGNMKRVSDVLAFAASSANTDVNQLGDAMSYAAPVAQAYGISLEESAAAVGFFSDAGIQGSRAGMSLKNTISQLANPVGKTAKKLKALGLSADDVNPEVKSLAEIMETLEGAGVKATDAIELVGAEAGPGFAALLTIGSKGLEEFTKEIENSEGAAQSMADIMTDNLGGDIKALSSVWESFKLQLFFKQEGFMRDITQGLYNFVEKVIDAIPAVERFIQKNSEIFKGLALGAGILAGLIAITVGFIGAMSLISLLVSPIGLAVSGIMALGVAVYSAYQNFEPFRNIVDGVIDKAKMLYKILSGQDIGISGDLNEENLKIVETFKTVKSAVNDAKETFDIFKEAASILVENVSEKFGNLVERFSGYKETFDETWSALIEIFGRGSELVADIFTTLAEVLSPVFSILVTALQIIGDIAMWAFEFIILPLADLVMSAFSAMWSLVGPLLSLFGAHLENVAVIALWLWDNALKPLVEFLGGAFKTHLEMATSVIDGIGAAFEWVGDKVSSVTEMVRGFSDLIKNIKVPDWITSAVGGVVNFVTGGGGSHYHGLDAVPYDGYQATLHKGERVLTAQENRAYEGGGQSSGGTVTSVSVTGNQFIVRQESDIEKIAYELAKLIEREGGQMGV